MDPAAIAASLSALGCPGDRVGVMASQLAKRARQLQDEQGWSEEAALDHLIRLMAGGWAAPGPGRAPLPQDIQATVQSPRPWALVETKALADYRIFQVRSARKRHPGTGVEHDLFAIDCADWVTVVALTPSDELVLVEQFRHGSGTVELETPGGVIDPDDTDPVAAGCRELEEETRYVGKQASLLATVFPNPAIQSNRCHVVLVTGCAPTGQIDWDPMEELAVRLVPAESAPLLIRDGAVRHALAIAALAHFWIWRQVP